MFISQGRNEKYFYTPCVEKNNAINVWFCFPADYNIGMSSLGFLHLFSLLDRKENVIAERIFYDTQKTFISLFDVDLISFSVSFEFDFLAIFNMLEKNGLQVFAKNRPDDAPLLMGGGAVLTANPEPFADIFDFIIIGDGEDVLLECVDSIANNKNLDKKNKLKKLSELQGVYVPSLQKFSDIKRRIFKSHNCIYSPIVTSNTAFSDSFLIEVTRGCPYKCNFCMTSHINHPAHYASFSSIKDAIDIGLSTCSTIGLLGALVPANPCFEDLCQYILDLRKIKEFKVSIGSLRADFITPLNIQMLTVCGQKNTTIAIEAGSQRIRDFINKKLTEEQIMNAVEVCYTNGLEGLKLYAMIGFPDETMEDVAALINLTKKIKQKKKITLSVNSFVPKKQTPFENEKMESIKSLEKKMNFLKKESHKSGIIFRPCSLAWNEIQGVISTGNRDLCLSLYAAYKDGATIGAFRKNFRNM